MLVEFMLLILLKLKIAWRLFRYPLFTYLISSLYRISFSSLPPYSSLYGTLLTGPILSNSHASSPSHRDDVLTLLGLWLPVSSGWRWPLTWHGYVGPPPFRGCPYLSQMTTLSSWWPLLPISPSYGVDDYVSQKWAHLTH